MKYDVFISYRREGGDTLSQLIYDRLTHRGYRVFLDIESLNAGKFNEKLLEVIEECKDMVIVLPPNAMDRCKNEGDWLYRELEHGMKHKKNIVPVMMKNFKWPDDIPEEIADIQNYNGILDNKDYFDAVIDKLTTLLISRPVFGGQFFRKHGEKKYSFHEKLKRRRKHILLIAALILVAAGILGFLNYREKQKKMAEQNSVKITLTPPEEMSASEYYDAIEIVKKRFEILAEGYKISYKEEKDEVEVTVPLDVFHDINVPDILQSYVTRPTEIYLSQESQMADRNQSFHIERTDIKNVEIVTDIPVEVDLDKYEFKGLDSKDECRFVVVEVDENTVEEAKKWMSTKEDSQYVLIQDRMTYDNAWYYSLISVFENDNRLYILDNYQYDNLFNLLIYNYENETFSNGFWFKIEEPVQWENDEKTTEFGKNQINEDELSGTLARFDFETYSTEITDGEFYDVVKSFKARLDSFGVPYAFGYYVNNPHIISVKINPEYLNDLVLENIGTIYKLSVGHKFSDILPGSYVEKAEVKEIDGGKYCLELTSKEIWSSYGGADIEDKINEDDEVFMGISTSPNTPVDKAMFSEMYQGNKFVIDSLSSFGLDSIDDENKFMLDFLASITNTEMPFNYHLKYSNLDDGAERNLIVADPVIPDKMKTELEEKLGKIDGILSYNATIFNIGHSVTLEIVCEDSDSYEESVNQVFQKVYKECQLDTGEILYVTIRLLQGKGEKKENPISFILNNSLESKKRQLTVYFTEVATEKREELNIIFNEDEFYKQFTISDFYMENERIAF